MIAILVFRLDTNCLFLSLSFSAPRHQKDIILINLGDQQWRVQSRLIYVCRAEVLAADSFSAFEEAGDTLFSQESCLCYFSSPLRPLFLLRFVTLILHTLFFLNHFR